ncbi:sugar ABC transporter permease [Paenibacillus psychroresistens]|uniref:Sugar ABC transporter permease n=1 Tax=Paenibacillus psychroresistens TaxID=1778678 RepID=A0A6B8RLJ3_9BACL|nr:ABC transporter permease subunit [Paenibacillus psychroresistens]QGQ97261.1 sugar ABC transporter permease [Paenibacillus psychroresistens]
MLRKRTLRELPFHLMILPGAILVFIYSYVPMAGIIMAFERFSPTKGMFTSPWVGWANFRFMLNLPDIFQVLWNTVFIAIMKIVLGVIIPVIFTLLLNEIRKRWFKRSLQTIIYFPHFLSWIILSGIIIDILSPSSGIVNQLLGWFGIEPIYFLGDVSWFPYTLVSTDIWKEFGYGTIIYLAALTGIDPTLYEAAKMDGAGRLKQTLHVTLPGLLPIIMVMTILSMGNVLNAGFEQVFNLYSPQVYKTGDIIDTLVFRLGMVDANYGVATAVGLFKSVVSFTMLGVAYALAYRYTDHRIF